MRDVAQAHRASQKGRWRKLYPLGSASVLDIIKINQEVLSSAYSA
jgi:hypothetical protein